jgi:hypothetical protein
MICRYCAVIQGTFILNQQNGIINPAKEADNQAAWHRDLPYQILIQFATGDHHYFETHCSMILKMVRLLFCPSLSFVDSFSIGTFVLKTWCNYKRRRKIDSA